MKFILLTLCCLMVSTTFAAEPVWGKIQNGLATSIALPQIQFKPGEAISVSFTKRNSSKKDLQIWHSGFWPNHQIRVCDSRGRLAELTDFGKVRFTAFDPGGARNKNFPVVLKPGEEDITEGKQDLSQLYKLTEPGLYSVQYLYEEYQGGWEGQAWSNVLIFQIIKAN